MAEYDLIDPSGVVVTRLQIGEGSGWVPPEGHTIALTDGSRPYNPPVAHATQALVISDRQFFQQLAILGEITEEEAEEAVGAGVIPASMLALVNQLPEAMRFDARMKLRGATQFNRTAPLTQMLAQAYGWTSQQVDALWAAAAEL